MSVNANLYSSQCQFIGIVYFAIHSFNPLCIAKWLREARAIEISIGSFHRQLQFPDLGADEHSLSHRQNGRARKNAEITLQVALSLRAKQRQENANELVFYLLVKSKSL